MRLRKVLNGLLRQYLRQLILLSIGWGKSPTAVFEHQEMPNHTLLPVLFMP